MEVSVIVAAGGQSSRFFRARAVQKNILRSAPAVSKLFCDLAGSPVLLHSLRVFADLATIREIILAVPQNSISEVEKWLRSQSLKSVRVVAGGATRAESVFRGIQASSPRSKWILVHDGARPFVTKSLIRKMFLFLNKGVSAVIAAKKIIPTIKKVSSPGWVVETIDRTGLWEAQTPQVVDRSKILEAYRTQPEAFLATDESSLIEAAGGRVAVCEVDFCNPKITTHEDLELAQRMLTPQNAAEQKFGLGKDLHRLVTGRKMILGGVEIPSSLGPKGHSDGDALLHAISDAILGVLGDGDIGDFFSDQNSRYKNISSCKIFAFVLDRARKKRWSIKHIDTVIHLEKPKLGAYKEKIKNNIARLARLSGENVSIKAKTAEGFGVTRGGEAVACDALVTLQRSPL